MGALGSRDRSRDSPCTQTLLPIRDMPDPSTFRGKGATLVWLDKLRGSLSLTLYNNPTNS